MAVDGDMSLLAAMPHADGGPFLNRAFIKWPMLPCPASWAVAPPTSAQHPSIIMLLGKHAAVSGYDTERWLV